LATSRRTRATCIACFGFPALAGATLGPIALQYQIQIFAFWFRISDRILRYNATVVFDINIEFCGRKHARPKL